MALDTMVEPRRGTGAANDGRSGGKTVRIAAGVVR